MGSNVQKVHVASWAERVGKIWLIEVGSEEEVHVVFWAETDDELVTVWLAVRRRPGEAQVERLAYFFLSQILDEWILTFACPLSCSANIQEYKHTITYTDTTTDMQYTGLLDLPCKKEDTIILLGMGQTLDSVW